MGKVVVITKHNLDNKIEILDVYQKLEEAVKAITEDLKNNYPNLDYDISGNLDNIIRAFAAVGSYHIVITFDFPTYHLWERELR